MVNGFGVVAQGLLREPLRVTALECALGPGISVRVQRHTVNVQPLTTLPEFCRAVAGANGAQIWKERSSLRTTTKDHSDFISEANQSGFDAVEIVVSQFLPSVGNGSSWPVDVFSKEESSVALRGTGVPEEFVEIAALVIVRPGAVP